jgi:hypothetical protein
VGARTFYPPPTAASRLKKSYGQKGAPSDVAVRDQQMFQRCCRIVTDLRSAAPLG